MCNILFTSVGRRVELLRLFQNAYKTLGVQGNLIAVDIDALAPALQVADRSYIVPRLSEPNYIPTLLDICRRENIHAIFPLIDPDILILAQNRQAFEEVGSRVGVVGEDVAHQTMDKWHTYALFQSLGIPTPCSWLPAEFDFNSAIYPLFIKPRQGSAAQYTFRVNDESELRFFIEYVPNPIIQEHLPGPEITTDVVCNFQGDVLGIVSRQRIEVRWGEVAKGVTIYDEKILQTCQKIAQALSIVGSINIQCMMKDGVPYFTEINARFGGGTPLGVAAGVNSPLWLLANLAGIDVEIPPIGTYTRSLHLTRFDDSFLLNPEQHARMASQIA